jgi:hydrogenase expression/formation protein
VVDARQQDDAGVVTGEAGYITVAVDGMHSRLSEFPFLAGFHAARAALRDVYVMGSKPRALISDLHLADDGDIGKLFDFTAGVACVGELCSTPLVAGSTLRVGGDMVFGERLVASVAAVGTSREPPKARRQAEAGDVILLTEGKGGGTVSTIAIYHQRYDVVKETLNVEFMQACEAVMERSLLSEVHAMSDVTNGGVRGDAWEISRTARKKLVFYEEELYKSVNPRVLEMLQELEIDPFGISTDSLMLILPQDSAAEVKAALRGVAKVYEVGRVEVGRGAYLENSEGERELKAKFREAAYTKVKKIIGEGAPKEMDEMRRRIEEAAARAAKKKLAVRRFILRRD